MSKCRRPKLTCQEKIEEGSRLIKKREELGAHAFAEWCWREGIHYPTALHYMALAEKAARQ
jgi:hypothetical protein